MDTGARELQYKVLCGHLNYVSEDVCKYDGLGDNLGLQIGRCDTSAVDIVSDTSNVSELSLLIGAIYYSEVFEHLSDPMMALYDFSRLLRLAGRLLIIALFSSPVHFAKFFLDLAHIDTMNIFQREDFA